MVYVDNIDNNVESLPVLMVYIVIGYLKIRYDICGTYPDRIEAVQKVKPKIVVKLLKLQINLG